jgi:hypothetical protein
LHLQHENAVRAGLQIETGVSENSPENNRLTNLGRYSERPANQQSLKLGFLSLWCICATKFDSTAKGNTRIVAQSVQELAATGLSETQPAIESAQNGYVLQWPPNRFWI